MHAPTSLPLSKRFQTPLLKQNLPFLIVFHRNSQYLFRLIYLATVLGLMGVLVLTIVKTKYPIHLQSDSVLIWNTTMAVAGLVALSFCFGRYLFRVFEVYIRGMRWYTIKKIRRTMRFIGRIEDGKDRFCFNLNR